MSAPAKSETLTDDLRDRLRSLADLLIPAAHGMPAASEIGVAAEQVDRVLDARRDLAEPLVRALSALQVEGFEPLLDELRHLEADDPPANEALLLTVVGGYYIHPEVRRRLGYDGQVPVEVRPEIIPNYVEEGLIDPVVERGPIYRRPPEEEDTP
jgi:hypothetical protein